MDRNIKLRENYKRLREAGFSTADATRYRGSSDFLIEQAIVKEKLPELRQEKRGRAKPKIVFTYEAPRGDFDKIVKDDYIKSLLKNTKKENLKTFNEIVEKIEAGEKTGTRTISVTISLSPDSMEDITNFHFDSGVDDVSVFKFTNQSEILAEAIFAIDTYINPYKVLMSLYNNAPFLFKL